MLKLIANLFVSCLVCNLQQGRPVTAIAEVFLVGY